MPELRTLVGRISPALLLLLFICAGPANAAADSPFTGRWRIDTASFKGNVKPLVLKLDSDGFSKDGDEQTKADGQFHLVRGDGYVDEQSISVESEYLIKEVDKIRGKTVYMVDYVISADGDTLITRVSSFTSPNGQVVRGETTYRRKGGARKGDHPITGEWERANITVDAKSDWILKLDGNRFSSRTDGGVGYDAVIGGEPAKIDGDNSGARSRISRPQPDLIVETVLSAKGERDATLSMRLLPDNKTIFATAVYAKGKTSTTFYLHKLAQ